MRSLEEVLRLARELPAPERHRLLAELETLEDEALSPEEPPRFGTRVGGHLSPDDGMPSASVLKPEWIRAVDRVGLGPRIATLPAHRWDEVHRAILHVLGFE